MQNFKELDVGRCSIDIDVLENLYMEAEIASLHRHLVITTSSFEVAMLPDRENSCRTIQNLTSVDVSLTLASSKTCNMEAEIAFLSRTDSE